MKNILLRIVFIFVVMFSSYSFAQTDSTNQIYGWKHTVVAGITGTQMSFKDWAQGGENALSYSALVDGKSIQDLESTNWSNSYKLAYGQTRLGSKPLRKTEDKLEFESVLTYKVGTVINPYVSASLKTQFDVGYKYDDASNTQTPVSRLWAPAYLQQSIGAGYQPIAQLKTRLGAALREVRSKAGYIENNKTEGGLESITDGEFIFQENVRLTSKLEMFAPFNTLDVVVVRSDNMLAVKITKIVSITFNAQFINDANIAPQTQIKEILGLGIVYALL
ncbi:MAG: DUF3078 domain-containing protein [Bacteroidota bacterium]|nr:DUF3078 domain-containing protein [Bacteroidota bacterium]